MTSTIKFEAVCPKRFSNETDCDSILADSFVQEWVRVVAGNAFDDLTADELSAGSGMTIGQALGRVQALQLTHLNYAPPGFHLVFGVRIVGSHKAVVLRLTAFDEVAK